MFLELFCTANTLTVYVSYMSPLHLYFTALSLLQRPRPDMTHVRSFLFLFLKYSSVCFDFLHTQHQFFLMFLLQPNRYSLGRFHPVELPRHHLWCFIVIIFAFYEGLTLHRILAVLLIASRRSMDHCEGYCDRRFFMAVQPANAFLPLVFFLLLRRIILHFDKHRHWLAQDVQLLLCRPDTATEDPPPNRMSTVTPVFKRVLFKSFCAHWTLREIYRDRRVFLFFNPNRWDIKSDDHNNLLLVFRLDLRRHNRDRWLFSSF